MGSVLQLQYNSISYYYVVEMTKYFPHYIVAISLLSLLLIQSYSTYASLQGTTFKSPHSSRCATDTASEPCTLLKYRMEGE